MAAVVSAFRYDTPSSSAFSASVPIGPRSLSSGNDNDYYDVGTCATLRLRGDYSVGRTLGYSFRDTTNDLVMGLPSLSAPTNRSDLAVSAGRKSRVDAD